MMNEQKVPQLRFSGFGDKWEEKKLEDISNKVTEKNYDREFDETFTNSAEQGVISQRDYFDHDISNDANIDGYYIVRNNDFVYNPRISTAAPVGPINRNKLGRSGVMSPLYYVFRTKNVDYSFLEKYFKSNYWYDFMFLNGDSGARSDRFSIKDNVFRQMPICMPIALEEQQKIGCFLTKIDSLIQAKIQKLESLKSVKKSLLQKCFPKDGEKVPQMRFEGFSGDWEEKKLNSGFYIKSRIGWQRLNKKEYMLKGDYYLVTGTDIDEDLNTVDFTRCFFVTKERYELDNKIQLQENDIIVTKDGTIGKIAIITELNKPATLNSHLFVVRDLTNTIKPTFLKTVFLSPIFQKYVDATKTGSTLTGLPQKTFVKFCFLCPKSIEEQKKIGQFFSKYDSLISLQQKEIENLKTIKKSLLQKMFV